MQIVNLAEKLFQINDYWQPHIIGELNDQHLKLVKCKGEFLWHHHAKEDELFLVLHGVLRMRLREEEHIIHPGELFIVPRGVEHCPIAEEECHVLLLEPASTLNTGNIQDERTLSQPPHL